MSRVTTQKESPAPSVGIEMILRAPLLMKLRFRISPQTTTRELGNISRNSIRTHEFQVKRRLSPTPTHLIHIVTRA